MLGQTISDPDGIEGSIPQLPGLGLLNISTVMTAEKTTKQVEFEFEGKMCKGYEIHQGRTEGEQQAPVTLQDNCIGTYIHGFLDNPSVIEFIDIVTLTNSRPTVLVYCRKLAARINLALPHSAIVDHIANLIHVCADARANPLV